MSDGFLLYPPASSGGGSLADGDYGDVTVSGGGTVIDIDADAVGTTEIADDSVTDAKLRDSAAVSVIGNPTAFAADPIDIPSGGNDLVLIANGTNTAIGFGQVVAGGIASNAVTTAKILDNNVTFAKMENILTDSLIGRDTAGTGDPENIGLNATLEMDGGGNLQRAALTGDVTASAGSNATTIAGDAVTFAKMQDIATDTLIGRDTAGTGDPENITLNATLSMTGGGALQRAALTGDVTASAGSNATTIASGVVTNAKMAGGGSTAVTVHTEYYKCTDIVGVHNTGPTLAQAATLVSNGADPENHAVGFILNSTQVSWARFGFAVPQGISGDLTVKICFLLNSGPNPGDQVDIDVVGTLYEDNQAASSTTNNFSAGTVLVIDGYSAGHYAIVDLNSGGGVGLSVAPGNFIQGVIQRDAQAGNGDDTYGDLIVLQWVQFNGQRLVIV